MAQSKKKSQVGLKELAEVHLELGKGGSVTHHQLNEHLQDMGYSVEQVETEVEDYFSQKQTKLFQSYELEKNGESYRLNIEKQNGSIQNYWFQK